MEAGPLTSSLSARSHEPVTNSNVSPRLSFRNRRRTRDSFHRTDRQSDALLRSSHPWQRIKSRLSAMDDLAHLPAAAASCVSTTDADFANASEFSTTLPSPATSLASSATRDVLRDRERHPNARARRMVTTGAKKRRPVRRLLPPPRPALMEKDCASVTEFLKVATLSSPFVPEVADADFKPHVNLLRKTTLDALDLNRYLFTYKPLAKVNAVLNTVLLAAIETDQKTFPMTALFRSAVMYVTGNALSSFYVMTYSAQLKSILRSRPPAEGTLPPVVLEGQGLSDMEVAVLDFVQELASPEAAISSDTSDRVSSFPHDGRLERLAASAAAYGAFLSSLTSVIDIELTHACIQYASNNLKYLPWKSSGAAVNVGFTEDDLGDFGSSHVPSGFGSKYRPRRERLSLTRNYERHYKDRSGSAKTRGRGMKRVSHFFTASFMGPKAVTDVNRITENWMKEAKVPPPGQLFDINDDIHALYGFHPFYFSTAAMEREAVRRAFLFGAKELLFTEKDLTRRLKFILCYTLSSGKERRRIQDSDQSRSFEKQGVHNGHSISSVYTQRPYDALSIMSAHAAYLACKYGATPAELVAATDVSRVRSAMERYAEDKSRNWSNSSFGFPLTKRDCAAVLIVHSLLQDSPCIKERDLSYFETAFEGVGKSPEFNSRAPRRALLELLGAASMWSAFERYATATLGFDIDCTSNMVFGQGRAEPAVCEFIEGEGWRIGLSLAAGESSDVVRVRSDSQASRTSSLRPTLKSSRRLYRKRTSSALSTRVGRMFSSPTQQHSKPIIAN